MSLLSVYFFCLYLQTPDVQGDASNIFKAPAFFYYYYYVFTEHFIMAPLHFWFSALQLHLTWVCSSSQVDDIKWLIVERQQPDRPPLFDRFFHGDKLLFEVGF